MTRNPNHRNLLSPVVHDRSNAEKRPSICQRRVDAAAKPKPNAGRLAQSSTTGDPCLRHNHFLQNQFSINI